MDEEAPGISVTLVYPTTSQVYNARRFQTVGADERKSESMVERFEDHDGVNYGIETVEDALEQGPSKGE